MEYVVSNVLKSFADQQRGVNAFKYDNISVKNIALLSIISIPSTVDVERSFSHWNLIKTVQRNRLTLKHSDALMNICSNGGPVDKQSMEEALHRWYNSNERIRRISLYLPNQPKKLVMQEELEDDETFEYEEYCDFDDDVDLNNLLRSIRSDSADSEDDSAGEQDNEDDDLMN